jgi:hypothetical protein
LNEFAAIRRHSSEIVVTSTPLLRAWSLGLGALDPGTCCCNSLAERDAALFPFHV